MKAPSEKHLEDWIVAHPEQVTFGDHIPFYEGDDVISRIIRRQPRFPNGRPDLIVKSGMSIVVIELKAGAIKSRTITQLLRYIYDLRDIGYKRHVRDVLNSDFWLPTPEFENHMISGYVIGHSIGDDNISFACALLNITPILYDYDGQDYTFRHAPSDKIGIPDEISYQISHDWAEGAIGQALYDVMYERAEFKAELENQRNCDNLARARQIAS